MSSNLLDLGAVGDQLALADAHRQRQADEPPGDRVEVLPVGDEAFDVDDAVFDGGDRIGCGRQRDQVGLFLGVAINGPLLRLAMAAHVGDLGQPAGGDFVEVFQRVEGSAVEQVRLDVMELSFDLALQLSRQLRTVAIRRSEPSG